MKDSGMPIPQPSTSARKKTGYVGEFVKKTTGGLGARKNVMGGLSAGYANKQMNFVPASSNFSSVAASSNTSTSSQSANGKSAVTYPISQYYQGNRQSLQPKQNNNGGFKRKSFESDASSSQTDYSSNSKHLRNNQSQAVTASNPSRSNQSQADTVVSNSTGFDASNYGYGYGGYASYSTIAMPNQQSVPIMPTNQFALAQQYQQQYLNMFQGNYSTHQTLQQQQQQPQQQQPQYNQQPSQPYQQRYRQ
jgi:hypothetical protein